MPGRTTGIGRVRGPRSPGSAQQASGVSILSRRSCPADQLERVRLQGPTIQPAWSQQRGSHLGSHDECAQLD